MKRLEYKLFNYNICLYTDIRIFQDHEIESMALYIYIIKIYINKNPDMSIKKKESLGF